MALPLFIEDQAMENSTIDQLLPNVSFDQISYSPGTKCVHLQAKNGTLSVVNIISYCYVLPTVCAIGILGNLANLITLASGRLKAVSYMYLRGLGIADMLCMIFVLIFVSFEMINASPNYRHWLNFYGVVWFRAHLMLLLINWPVSAGILIVLALTIERYISIAFPILFREWNSPKRATLIITAAYVFSLILYIPMCWQHEVVPICSRRRNLTYTSPIWHNGTAALEHEELTGWVSTDNSVLVKNKAYVAYKYSREGILKIIPIVALTFLNLQIIIAFKKVRKRRRRLNTSANQNAREQRSLLFLLAGIVVLFFICNIPAAINLIFITEAMKAKTSYVIFRAIANLLEITNHALNFYNFCLCSSDFRQTFFLKFPCVKRMQESAEDIKRRVSSSVARVHQASRGASIVTNSQPLSQVITVSTSLKSATSADKRPPLRRALSSDALLRLNHRTLKDDRGRRFGHHYSNALAYSAEGKYLAPTNGTRLRVRYKRSDSFQNFIDSSVNFEAIPEDYTQLSIHDPGDNSFMASALADCVISDLQMNDYQNGASSTLALVDFDAGAKQVVVKKDSSLTYVSADYAIIITDNDDNSWSDSASPERVSQNVRSGLGFCDSDSDDALTYSSANDVYL